jgi:hypothetical protein
MHGLPSRRAGRGPQVKFRELSPWVADAVTRTHGLWDNSDRGDIPSWDGKTLHLGRLTCEANVIHEVGHYIVAPARHRVLPNYGLRRDPDGGPSTDSFIVTDMKSGVYPVDVLRMMRDLARTAPDRFMQIIDAKEALEEALASFVTVRLLAQGGLPWAAEMRKVFGKLLTADPYAAEMGNGMERFWAYFAEMEKRGIDPHDPLASFARLAAPKPLTV